MVDFYTLLSEFILFLVFAIIPFILLFFLYRQIKNHQINKYWKLFQIIIGLGYLTSIFGIWYYAFNIGNKYSGDDGMLFYVLNYWFMIVLPSTTLISFIIGLFKLFNNKKKASLAAITFYAALIFINLLGLIFSFYYYFN